MGDFGAARQLQRSEWYWLYPQARLPHTPPRAPPPPVPAAYNARCPSTSTALLDWTARPLGRTPTPSSRPRRSPPPPRTPTNRSRAAPPKPSPAPVHAHPAASRTPAAPAVPRSPPRLRPLAAPAAGRPSPRLGRSAGAARTAAPGTRPGAEVPAPELPAGDVTAGPAPSSTAPATPSTAAAASPTASGGARHGSRPSPRSGSTVHGGHVNAPGGRTVALAGPGRSASWHCPSSPVVWSCGCAASEQLTAPARQRRNRSRDSPRD